MISTIPELNGLVLSGGKSTRMGRDKGALVYHGVTQRKYLYQMLLPYCKEVYISCRSEQREYTDELPVIEDAVEGTGPVTGILSAFRKKPHSAWLVLACDVPFLTSGTLTCLVKGRNPEKVATAFFNPATGFPEPLITIWEPSGYLLLSGFCRKGYNCPRKALINSDIQILHAPDAKELQNINLASEYDELMKSF